MEYKFLGYETAGDVKPSANCGYKLDSLLDLYNVLSDGIWREATCAPRMQSKWNEDNKTLGQCSITAFLVQDIFGGEVYGIKRPDGSFHCLRSSSSAMRGMSSFTTTSIRSFGLSTSRRKRNITDTCFLRAF